MTVTTNALRLLHRLHQQLTDLRERLERGPKQVQAHERNVSQLTQQLDASQSAAQHARMTADKKQLELKSSEDKIQDWKAKLNACSSNKEYQALLDQIAAAEMAGSVLADEILDVLEKIDELDGHVVEAKTKVAAGQRELERIKRQVADASAGIAADVERLEAELTRAEADLPADFRIDYDRVVKARGMDGLAPADDAFCGGCYQQITANMLNNLTLSRPVFCSACGRLLYLAEDPAGRQNA